MRDLQVLVDQIKALVEDAGLSTWEAEPILLELSGLDHDLAVLISQYRTVLAERDELRDIVHEFVSKWDDYMGVKL